jgi:predicted DCC family thiol-disulfide oxidoreductase YuxK
VNFSHYLCHMQIFTKYPKRHTGILPVILFDGVCNFCNSTVNFTIKRDRKKRIKFAALQSLPGRQIAEQFKLPVNDLKSFVFIEDGVVYKRSTAALRVCRYLGTGWPLCYFFIIVPPFIRNGIYDFIAKNRYKWFGQRDKCMVPSSDVRARFIA